MKPMPSKTLDAILDKLVAIGKKRVKKSETMLNSLNIRDDMIKIAARQVVVDPMEKKLRMGYVYPISKEATQFTALPTQEKDKKKPRFPASVMGKYPSGSETTTPYIGEMHGGDQVPAAETLAERKNTHLTKTSAGKLSEVIQDLKNENQIFVDLKDVVMRLSQKGQQSSFSIESLCETLSKEGITLIKLAEGAEQLVPAGQGEQIVPTEGPVEGQPEEYGERLEVGKMIEMEHRDTIEAFRTQLQQGNDLPDEKIAEMIATDHLKENPAYYDEMIDEAMAGTGHVVTAASIEQIKDNIEHARESRSYNIERLQEKGLTDAEKDRYEKAKRKWEKEVDRLDRELSRAMKSERKQEREEAKKEKETEQVQEQPQESAVVASVDGHTVIAQEPLTETTFDIDKFLSPAEYQEFQRLVDLRGKTWEMIADREKRNIEEGLPPYTNIDYSEVEVINTQLKQYQERAKGMKGEEKLPEAPEAEMPSLKEPGMPPAGGPEEGVLTKRPEALPEFASVGNRLIKKGEVLTVYNRKFEATPIWDASSETGELTGYEVKGESGQKFRIPTKKEMNKNELEYAIGKKLTGMMKLKKHAVTCQDFPEICKNCKALVVPSGYAKLTFLDHTYKPFCSTSDNKLCIGFRYAYMRECRGYDGILKELTQKIETPTQTIFQELKDRGEKPILKKEAKAVEDAGTTPRQLPIAKVGDNSYYVDMRLHQIRNASNPHDYMDFGDEFEMIDYLGEQGVNTDQFVTEIAQSTRTAAEKEETEATERGKKICPKCVNDGYFIPAGKPGSKSMTHDWHKLWDCDFLSVNHDPKGVCMPGSLAMQSKPDSGVNQFDTEKNRIVNK